MLTVKESEVKTVPTVSGNHNIRRSVNVQHILFFKIQANTLYLVHEDIQKMKIFDVVPKNSEKGIRCTVNFT